MYISAIQNGIETHEELSIDEEVLIIVSMQARNGTTTVSYSTK